MENTRDPREKPNFDVLGSVSKMRMERGWTEYELAQRSGLTQSTIHGWYKRDLTPTLPLIEKICAAFGLTLSQFFSADGTTEAEASTEYVEYISLWKKMNPEQRTALINHLQSILK